MEDTALEPPEGQVCDRCRQKKIKCDGAAPQCSNCASSGSLCEVSVRLRRKTKIRGYTSNNSYLERLETDNAQLRSQLQSQRDECSRLQNELDRARDQLAAASRPVKLRRLADPGPSAQSPNTVSGDSELPGHHRTAFVVKHMGRMVFDQADIGRFAGSTTGVHFVASVEELCRRRYPSLRAFPEDCFRLHIVQSISPSGNLKLDVNSICTLLPESTEYYAKQLDIFNDSWLALCPIVPRSKFVRDVSQALHHVRSKASINGKVACSIQALVTILMVNSFADDITDPGQDARFRNLFDLSCQLHHLVIARADLESLQSLILFSFFIQMSGQTLWLTQVNGVQVRLAQSLGMHRHARRFRFTQSETELRKRMWWWVYCYDKLTSIVHGMPKLINDIDVDNDLPIDCELADTNVDGLSHPLPGEPSPVAFFIHYIHICKILSAVLGQLYTTSQRRGGESKIAGLDRDLRVWHQSFCNALQVSTYEISDFDKTMNRGRWLHHADDECAMIADLDLLANFAVILIHRPALTFDNGTQRFRESLGACMRSCNAIIQLASASPIHQKAIHRVPFGSAFIFQSALMQVFHRCSIDSAGILDEQSHDSSSLRTAIEILQDANLPHGRTEQVIFLLETLSNVLYVQETATVNSPGGLPASNSIDRSFIIPYGDDFRGNDIWAPSALESLNHLDVLYGSWEAGDPFPNFDA